MARGEHFLFGPFEEYPALSQQDHPLDFRLDFLDGVGHQREVFPAERSPEASAGNLITKQPQPS